MKLHTLLAISALVSTLCCSSKAQEIYSQLTITVTNTTPNGSVSRVFTGGVAEGATNAKDTLFDEVEIPSLPPPAGVFLVFSKPPIENDIIWLSPKDIRAKESDSASWRVDYILEATWNGGTLRFSLANQIPATIDSAYLVDDYSTFPNSFQKWKVSESSFEVINPSIREYRLIVWYNNKGTSIQDVTAGNSLEVYPNPSNGSVTIKGLKETNNTVVITDVNGSIIALYEKVAEQTPVRLPFVSNGMYGVTIMNNGIVLYRTTLAITM